MAKKRCSHPGWKTGNITLLKSTLRKLKATAQAKKTCWHVVLNNLLAKCFQEKDGVEGKDYPIQPKDIDIDRVCLIFEGREIKGLLNTFGHAETEWSAELIVRLCQKAGRWLALTHEELDKEWLKTPRGRMQFESNEKSRKFMGWPPSKHAFCFFYLDEGGWVIQGDDGKYRVTEAFIKRCYERHPVRKKRP